MREREDQTPWYRQFWPWFLIAIPAASVIASVATVILALRQPDGLVVDDYYKQGLAINRVLERDRRARAMGLSARVRLDTQTHRVALGLKSDVDVAPGQLVLRLLHPTRAHMDQAVTLRANGDGAFAATIAPLQPGHWHLQVESEQTGWRLVGRLRVPGQHQTRLAPAAPEH